MSLYDDHPLPWRAEKALAGGWFVKDVDSGLVSGGLAEPVAKLLAGAPQVIGAAESLLLDGYESEEAPEVSMVSTVSLNRLREALGQAEVAS